MDNQVSSELVEKISKMRFSSDVMPEALERTCRDLSTAALAFLGKACGEAEEVTGLFDEDLKPPEDPPGGTLGELYCNLLYIEYLARSIAKHVESIHARI